MNNDQVDRFVSFEYEDHGFRILPPAINQPTWQPSCGSTTSFLKAMQALVSIMMVGKRRKQMNMMRENSTTSGM